MPTVPNLEAPSVQAEPLPGRAYPRVDDSVSPASFGSGLAQGLEAVGGAGAEQEATLKRQNDHIRVVDANTQLEAAKTAMLYGKDGKGGAFSLHGLDAIDMPNKILPQYDQAAQGIANGLTPDQQRLFKGHIALGRNELDTSLNRYEYEESNRLSDAVYTNGAKQTITNATVGWRDPQNIAKARMDLQGLVTMQGDREGWTPDQRATQLAHLQAEMHFNVVDRQLADGQPNAALAYFKHIRDTGELTGEQSHQLGAQIDAALQQHTAQNQSEILSRMRDASTAAINGLAVSPANMPSRAAVMAAFPQDGDKRWKAMQDDITMGADLKGLSTLPAAEIQARVDSYKPTSVEGAADKFERYNAFAGAAQRVQSARAADPRQFVIDNKLGSNALDFSNTQSLTAELRTRLASTPQDSARMGGYVPPLSKPEAAQFAQRLETMDAKTRAQTLLALNSGLSDDRGFQTVMHQILPGSPVTAIVGSQLNQENPTNTPVWTDSRFSRDPSEQVRTLAGEALLNPQGLEKGGVPKFKLPSEEGSDTKLGLRDSFNTYAGPALAGRSQLGEALYAAFKANYAQRLAEAGNYSGKATGDDAALREASLKAVVGHVTTFNDGAVVVPPGLDPTRFAGIAEAAVKARATMVGLDYQSLQGYKLEEVGAVGSGRYQLVQGNAVMTNPGGKTFPGDSQPGLFQIDLRNQYMPDRSKPTVVDARRQAGQGEPVAPGALELTSGEVPGQPNFGKQPIAAPKALNAPPVTGLSRSGGKGRTHPSQGAPDIE